MDESVHNKIDMGKYQKQCKLIQNNIRGRQLVLRYKHPEFEKILLKQAGLKASMYITRSRSRVNNIDSFLDTEILGKSDKYYLVITDEMTWNKTDSDRYFGGGVRRNPRYVMDFSLSQNGSLM